MNLGWLILITFIAGVIGTGIGGIIGAIAKKDSKKVVSLLLSLAAGVMIAVVCFDLLHEAFNAVENKIESIILVIIFTIVGYLVVYFINKFIDTKLKKEVPHTSSEEHPNVHDDLGELVHADHLEHHKNSDNHLFIAGLVMAIVIALHNLPEGMVIGASYANSTAIVGGSGLIISIVIGIHNIPEGMAVSVPLIAGGTKKWKAILYTALSGLPTVLGAIIGYLLGGIGPISLNIALSLASGAMLYVVFGELLPESILMWKSKLPALFVLIGLLIGFILVLF